MRQVATHKNLINQYHRCRSAVLRCITYGRICRIARCEWCVKADDHVPARTSRQDRYFNSADPRDVYCSIPTELYFFKAMALKVFEEPICGSFEPALRQSRLFAAEQVSEQTRSDMTVK